MVAEEAELVAEATGDGIRVRIETPFRAEEIELSEELLRRLGWERVEGD